MSLRSLLRTAAAAVFVLGTVALPAAAQQTSPIRNGNFQLDRNNDGTPDGWSAASGVRFVEEQGNRFIRLKSTKPGETVMQHLVAPLPAGAKAIEFSYRVRHEGIERGEKAWFDGRIMMNLLDAQDKKLASPGAPYFRGTSKGWQEKSTKFLVPEGATKLEMMLTLQQTKAGTLDLDDLKLTAIDPSTMPKQVEMASPVVPAPAAEKLPPELKVVGNQLQTKDGKHVWLQGLSVDSMQWAAGGERTVHTIEYAIDSWKANCVRLAVKEDFWFGTNEQQSDDGAGYRQLIESAVNTAAGRGAYIVIDLHRFRAPDENHLKFWREVAAQYKNHPAVLFELFNEAHSLTWEVWRNGGLVTDKVKPKADVVVENQEALKTFNAVGMQQLVDAVRETGAKNIVIVGGLDWSYDLGGILNGFAIDDPSGNGVMYSTHVYPWKSGWQEKFLEAAKKYPLFVGEVGCPEKWSDFSFIPPAQQKEKLGPGATWPMDMIGTIQKHKLNWTAFSFHPRCGPMVIKDWDYTPTSYWGVYVRDALVNGKVFEVERLR